MPTIRTTLTLLLASLGLALAQPAQGAPRKKKATTSKTTNKRSSSTSSKRKSSRTTQRSSQRRTRSTRAAAPRVLTEEQREQMRQDSIRLRTGGTELQTVATERLAQAPELLTTRFRQADSTLSRSELRELYFSPSTKEDTERFIAQIEQEVDRLIASQQFDQALKLVQQGLWRMPTHLGLIKRACDLTSHLKHPRFSAYIYQLIELLSMIAHSGDGTSPAQATEVRSLSDALLFEQLWKETPKERLASPAEVQEQGKRYYVFTIADEQGQPQRRYYFIRTTPYISGAGTRPN